MMRQLTTTTILAQYRDGSLTPEELVAELYDRLDTDATNAWISVRDSAAVLADARSLSGDPIEDSPLYGVPFAVKDNIDTAGLPTTAGCPAYAYRPEEHATVVEKLIDAGALLIGKTNMDQFATGLVGTRSPYGVCRNVNNPDYIAGGSSSGSAVAVARGDVAFALGTDTAGSGRVPAACNGVVGLKPSRGMVSTNGVVPACASLDCVSIFTRSCREALHIESVIAGYDERDAYSNRRAAATSFELRSHAGADYTVGVPGEAQLEFFGDEEAATLFESVRSSIEDRFAESTTVDFDPFVKTAALLYDGPWLAERLSAIEEFVETHPDAIVPVVRDVLSDASKYSALDTFRAFHELEALKQASAEVFEDVDVIVTPTIGTMYTIEDIEAEPIERNSKLGYYTDYVNLLDLAAIAVPTGRFEAGPGFGVTVLGEAGDDDLVASVGERIRTSLDDAPETPVRLEPDAAPGMEAE